MFKSLIAGTVILYNPDNSVIENIKSYVKALDRLYIIDNSTKIDKILVNKIEALHPAIVYLHNGGNKGIGQALNNAAKKALASGYQWLLTMDQDSKFEDIQTYLNCCNKYIDREQTALFAPNTDITTKSEHCSVSYPKVIITSGNLVNLKYFTTLGGFESKLFIDEIDHDYCLKAFENSLKVVQFKHSYLHHAIGDKTQLKSLIFGQRKYKSAHTYQHIYYQTRNRLYMAERHSHNFPEAFRLRAVLYKVIYKKSLRIIKWEDDKIRKLKAIYHGVRDYLNDHYGEYDA